MLSVPKGSAALDAAPAPSGSWTTRPTRARQAPPGQAFGVAEPPGTQRDPARKAGSRSHSCLADLARQAGWPGIQPRRPKGYEIFSGFGEVMVFPSVARHTSPLYLPGTLSPAVSAFTVPENLIAVGFLVAVFE